MSPNFYFYYNIKPNTSIKTQNADDATTILYLKLTAISLIFSSLRTFGKHNGEDKQNVLHIKEFFVSHIKNE